MVTGNTPLLYTQQTPLCFICETAERLYVICSYGVYTSICAEERSFGPYRPLTLHEHQFELHEASDRRHAPFGI
jgi:hypothetical protein